MCVSYEYDNISGLEYTCSMQLPPWAKPFMEGKHRYLVAHGGRGSGKSHAFAQIMLRKMRAKKTRVVCCREIQTSIRDSVHALLTDLIFANGWQFEFKVTQYSIIHIATGSKATFHGLKNRPESIKSIEGIDQVWVEESQTISETSMRLLIPTVRRPGSQIFLCLNPRFDSDYVYQRFVKETSDNVLCVQVNHRDNPWFPDVLKQELEYDFKHDPALYRHIWEGSLRPHGERGLFMPEVLQLAGPELSGEPPTIFGLDLSWTGFSALAGISISEDRQELYIHSLKHKSKVPLLGLVDWIGENDHRIVVDNARPEVIDLLQKAGYKAKRSKKGAGSVVKGADRMARFSKIWFAPGTETAMNEFMEIGFDEDDEITGTRDCYDACRYGLERMGGFKTISWSSL